MWPTPVEVASTEKKVYVTFPSSDFVPAPEPWLSSGNLPGFEAHLKPEFNLDARWSNGAEADQRFNQEKLRERPACHCTVRHYARLKIDCRRSEALHHAAF